MAASHPRQIIVIVVRLDINISIGFGSMECANWRYNNP